MRPADSCELAGRDFRVGSIFKGWLGTDLRIVTYGRSRASKVVLVLTGLIKSAAWK